ncbi:MAG: HYExAFE family protein, partial [Phycisphaerae bacterium]|nr:HYExAFE family protein [Phycisphaerae bacterium]
TTREDVVGLQQWARVFGEGFAGLIVFVYWLTNPEHGCPAVGQLHTFRDRRYLLAGMPVDTYAAALRDRSRKWQTVSVPARPFRELVRPVTDFI